MNILSWILIVALVIFIVYVIQDRIADAREYRRWVKSTNECSHCGGTGECPTCNGTGRAPKENRNVNGNSP